MVCRHTHHSLATSLTVRPSAITAKTALYLCSVTLISLMARECRVGTEVAVANQPKVCRTAAEGVLSPTSRTCTHTIGARAGSRTLNLGIKSPLLCQLSYASAADCRF